MMDYNSMVPSAEQTTTCPYNKAHVVLNFRFAKHLVKCRKSYQGEELETCPFNVTHKIPKPEIFFHTKTCTDRLIVLNHLQNRDKPLKKRKVEEWSADEDDDKKDLMIEPDLKKRQSDSPEPSTSTGITHSKECSYGNRENRNDCESSDGEFGSDVEKPHNQLYNPMSHFHNSFENSCHLTHTNSNGNLRRNCDDESINGTENLQNNQNGTAEDIAEAMAIGIDDIPISFVSGKNDHNFKNINRDRSSHSKNNYDNRDSFENKQDSYRYNNKVDHNSNRSSRDSPNFHKNNSRFSYTSQNRYNNPQTPPYQFSDRNRTASRESDSSTSSASKRSYENEKRENFSRHKRRFIEQRPRNSYERFGSLERSDRSQSGGSDCSERNGVYRSFTRYNGRNSDISGSHNGRHDRKNQQYHKKSINLPRENHNSDSSEHFKPESKRNSHAYDETLRISARICEKTHNSESIDEDISNSNRHTHVSDSRHCNLNPGNNRSLESTGHSIIEPLNSNEMLDSNEISPIIKQEPSDDYDKETVTVDATPIDIWAQNPETNPVANHECDEEQSVLEGSTLNQQPQTESVNTESYQSQINEEESENDDWYEDPAIAEGVFTGILAQPPENKAVNLNSSQPKASESEDDDWVEDPSIAEGVFTDILAQPSESKARNLNSSQPKASESDDDDWVEDPSIAEGVFTDILAQPSESKARNLNSSQPKASESDDDDWVEDPSIAEGVFTDILALPSENKARNSSWNENKTSSHKSIFPYKRNQQIQNKCTSSMKFTRKTNYIQEYKSLGEEICYKKSDEDILARFAKLSQKKNYLDVDSVHDVIYKDMSKVK